MEITVKVRPEIASVLRERLERERERERERGSSEDLLSLARRHGLKLRPMHPRSDDEQLATWFAVEADDEDKVDEVLEDLRASDDVEAAYIKPAEELP